MTGIMNCGKNDLLPALNPASNLLVLLRLLVVAAIFFAPPAWAVASLSGSKSTATASPTIVIANGIATSTITVTVNRTNNKSAGSGITVTLTGTGSSIISTSPATTNNAGVATFTVTDTVVELVTYTAVASEPGSTVIITQKPTVSFVRAPPTVAKSFSPATIAANGTSTLTITLTNPNAISITGATFTDTYPANLVNAGTPAVSNNCGGTVIASAGGTSLTLSGGTIPALGSCTVSATVTTAIAGSYANSTGAVTSSNAAPGTAASATLTVTAISAANSTVTANPTTILANGVSTSTITVTLRDGANLAVPGKTVTLAKSGGSSTISAASGTSDINGVVTFTVKDSVAEGPITYTATDTTDGIMVTQTASVTFIVTQILKNFGTNPIAINGTSTLTVTLSNNTGSSVGGAGFSDTYPAGLVNASNPSNSGSCGTGILSGATGNNVLGITGATIAANSACTVSVSVTAATAGIYSNTATNTSLLTSTASLTVTAISPTLSSVVASPTSVAANGTSTSTITVTLKDGAGNPVPGKTVTLTKSGGSSVITAVSNSGGVATFTVTDTIAEGPITYTATDTTDSITVMQTASVTFTRIAAPTVTKSFSPATIADYGTSTLTITLTNPNTVAITGVAFSDSYPATGGLANTNPLVLGNTCGGTNPGTSALGTILTLSGGTIPASGSCAVSVQVTAAFPGLTLSSPIVNSTGAVTSSNATSGTAASATLTVVNVSAANSMVVASPTSVPADNTTTSTVTVTLLDGVGNPVTGIVVSLAASSGSSTITVVSATTDVNGVATFTVKDSVVEVVTYTATDTTDTPNVVVTQQATVTFGTAVGSFNAYETSTSPATAASGPIYTKVAGAAFSLDFIALNSTKTAVFTTFTGVVKVELLGNTSLGTALDASNCPTTFTNIQPPLFATNPTITNGRTTVSFPAISNVWRDVRVRISYPAAAPTIIVCSTDNFAIRPNSLSMSITDSNWQTAGTARTLNNSGATGGNIHKAAQPFTIQATAYNAASTPAITGNYLGSPSAQPIACTLPIPTCTNGILTPGAWTAAGGTVTSTTASYSEAGSFNLTLQDTIFASVDSADGTPASCAGYYVCSAATSVGRFVPDHFVLATNNTPQFRTFNATDASCSSGAAPRRIFTYFGQPFGYVTAPKVLITAQNAANVTTANYTSNLWKLVTAAGAQDCTTNPDICTLSSGSVTQTYTYTTSTGALPNWDSTQAAMTTPAIVAGTNGTGTVTSASTDLLAFKRNTSTPLSLFTASITLTGSVKDTSEAGNCGVANCDITPLTPVAFSPVAFDSGDEFRYGRLKLGNAHGSELLKLPIPIQTQYWNGTSFVTNGADNCTTLAASNIKLTAPPAGVSATVGGAFSSGMGSLTLSPPTTAAKVAVDLCADLGVDPGTVCSATMANLPYLQGLWYPGTSYNNDPGARATFGVYKGANEFIYLRENY
jgi:hypothetical protein